MCVQSFDGQLTFYEQDQMLFRLHLPEFLVPGPLLHCPGTDQLITCTAAYDVQSFLFQKLAVAADTGAQAKRPFIP